VSESGTGQGRSRQQSKRRATSSSGERTETRGLVGQVKDKARTAISTRLEQQKYRATEGLGSIVEAVRRNNEQLRSENNMVAPYIDRIAERIERFAATIDGKEIDELMADVRAFARRRPEVVVGISFALGLAAARFLKSSGELATQASNAA
jgi:hypothetical protein